jgi:hypothetical protein
MYWKNLPLSFDFRVDYELCYVSPDYVVFIVHGGPYITFSCRFRLRLETFKNEHECY